MILTALEKLALVLAQLLAEEAVPFVVDAISAMIDGKKYLAARRAYEAARRIAILAAAKKRLG